MRGIAAIVAIAVIASAFLAGCAGNGEGAIQVGDNRTIAANGTEKSISLYQAIAEVRGNRSYEACGSVPREDAGVCYTYAALTIDGALCDQARDQDAQTYCKKAISIFGGKLDLCSRLSELGPRNGCNSKVILSTNAFGRSADHALAAGRVQGAFEAAYSDLDYKSMKSSVFEWGDSCVAQTIGTGVLLGCDGEKCDRNAITYALVACGENMSVRDVAQSGRGSVFERMEFANLVSQPKRAEKGFPLKLKNETWYSDGNATVAYYSVRSSDDLAYSYWEFLVPSGQYYAYGSMLHEQVTLNGPAPSDKFMAGFESLYGNMTGGALSNATEE
jgi:hypothetical protein